MTRARWIGTLAAALLLLTPALAIQGQKKDKPKDAKSLSDKAGEVTQTVDGATAKAKLDLKYYLDVEGWFDMDGLNISGLNMDGPAGHLQTLDGASDASLEPGDIIVEINGKKIKSPMDYADALNKATDHDKVKLKVKDINSGENQEFYAKSLKRGS